MASIEIYGDSITYGIGDAEGLGWANRLRGTMVCRMQRKSEPRGVIVHNSARFGMTLPEIVDRLPAWLEDRDGQGRLLAMVMAGFCDSFIPEGASEPKVRLQEFSHSVERYIKICRAVEGFAVLPLFIESPPVDAARPHPGNKGDVNAARTTEYQDMVRQIAAHHDVGFIATRGMLQDLPEDPLSEDGIHLSTAGHLAIHDLVLEYADALLAQAQ